MSAIVEKVTDAVNDVTAKLGNTFVSDTADKPTSAAASNAAKSVLMFPPVRFGTFVEAFWR